MENKKNINIRSFRKIRSTLNEIKTNNISVDQSSSGLETRKSKFKLVDDARRMKKYADLEEKQNGKLQKCNKLFVKNLAPLGYNNCSKSLLTPASTIVKTEQCISTPMHQPPTQSKKNIQTINLETMWTNNEYANINEQNEKLRATLQQFHSQMMGSLTKTDKNSITIHQAQ